LVFSRKAARWSLKFGPPGVNASISGSENVCQDSALTVMDYIDVKLNYSTVL
jgi:hypothetical protein